MKKASEKLNVEQINLEKELVKKIFTVKLSCIVYILQKLKLFQKIAV